MYIGIDLGGTNIAAGVVDEAGKIIYKSSVPMLAQRPVEEIVEDIANLCIDVVKGADRQISEIKSVGIGCPGTVDNKNGIVAYACNLRMQNTELGAMLEKKLGKPVNLENDANAAALGEYLVNGDNSDSFVLITLSTGVDGGISKEGDYLLNPLREYVYVGDYNKYREKTKIETATLFNDAGIIGVALSGCRL